MCSMVYYGLRNIESRSPTKLKIVFYIMGYLLLLTLPFICSFILSLGLLAAMIGISGITIIGFDWILLAIRIFLQDKKVNTKISEINILFGNLMIYLLLPVVGIPCAYGLALLLTVIYYILLAKNNTILWRRWWSGLTDPISWAIKPEKTEADGPNEAASERANNEQSPMSEPGPKLSAA